MQTYSDQYRDELLNNVLPFWMKYSIDKEYGGFLTSLDRDGSVFDTDKWVWLQAREVWTFATMYNRVEKRQEWLDAALQGAEFLRRFGHDASGAYYFGLTRQGQPLVQPYNIFSDCFAAMAYGALAASDPGLNEYAGLAKSVMEGIIARLDNPKGKYLKQVTVTRPMKTFALPMILCNLALELEGVMGKTYVDKLVRDLANEILRDYYKPDLDCILEQIGTDGSFVDSFEGRLISPGHTNESMWFLMDIGERLGDTDLIRKAADILIKTMDRGWDKEYGGIFYFMDIKGKHPQQLEADQKLWWVHLRALSPVPRVSGLRATKDWRPGLKYSRSIPGIISVTKNTANGTAT